jgi:hypothetical protein
MKKNKTNKKIILTILTLFCLLMGIYSSYSYAMPLPKEILNIITANKPKITELEIVFSNVDPYTGISHIFDNRLTVYIENKDIPSLAEALKMNKTITALYYREHGLHAETEADMQSIENLFTLLGSNTRLATFSIQGTYNPNPISPALVNIVRTNETLRVLILKYTLINEQGMEVLVKALEENDTITEISLSEIVAGNSGDYLIKALATLISNKKALTKIVLDGNAINNIKPLMESLEGTSIEELDLHSNDIGPDGGIAIADFLKKNKTIKVLDVSHNVLGKKGVTAILGALEELKNDNYPTLLNRIYLDNNTALDETGDLNLAVAASENTRIAINYLPLEYRSSTVVDINSGNISKKRKTPSGEEQHTFDDSTSSLSQPISQPVGQSSTASGQSQSQNLNQNQVQNNNQNEQKAADAKENGSDKSNGNTMSEGGVGKENKIKDNTNNSASTSSVHSSAPNEFNYFSVAEFNKDLKNPELTNEELEELKKAIKGSHYLKAEEQKQLLERINERKEMNSRNGQVKKYNSEKKYFEQDIKVLNSISVPFLKEKLNPLNLGTIMGTSHIAPQPIVDNRQFSRAY